MADLGYLAKIEGVSTVLTPDGYVEDICDKEAPAELTGRRKYEALRKMSYNSTIASVLYLQRCLLMGATWKVHPAAGETHDSEYVKFFTSVMDDMSQSWNTFMNKISTFLLYGWSMAEVVLKRRTGENSRYPDGKIGIADLRVLPQCTFKKWNVDSDGNLAGVTQYGNTYNNFKDVSIPADKLLIFNAFMDDDSPEGRSIFLGAYDDWVTYNISQSSIRTAMIRNLVGIPVISIPGKIFEDAQRTDTDEGKRAAQLIEQYKNIGRDINKNNISSFIIPSDGFRDNGVMNNVKQYDVRLLSLNGQSLIDVNTTQSHLRANMARVVIGDFLQIGTAGRTGSYSLGNTRNEMFARSINAINKNIADNVFNKKLIPMLGRLNRMDMTKLPYIAADNVNPLDIKSTTDALAQLQQAGANVFPDDNALLQVRDRLGIDGEIKRPEGYIPPYKRDNSVKEG